MEEVLSAPLGHAEWRLKAPSLEFLSVGSDKETMLPPNNGGQTGLDLVTIGQDDDLVSRKELIQGGEHNIEDLLKSTGYFCAEDILQLKGDFTVDSQGFPQRTTLEEAEDISDCALSWLFSPSSTDFLWGSSLLEGPHGTQEVTAEGDLISLSEPFFPRQESHRTSEQSLADLLSCDHPASPSFPLLTPECLGEVNPQGVTEEPKSLSPVAGGGARPSPETRDLPASGNGTLQGSPESFQRCVPAHAAFTSTPQDPSQGTVPLLDGPGCQGNESPSPTIPASLICLVEPFDSQAEQSEGRGVPPAVTARLTSDDTGERAPLEDTRCPRPPLQKPADEGLGAPGAPPGVCGSAWNVSGNLMELDGVSVETEHEGSGAMALDRCMEAAELSGEEAPRRVVSDGHAPATSALMARAHDHERPTPTNLVGRAHSPEPDASEFSDPDFGGSSPEPKWTSIASAERMSLSEMAPPDSVPMVSTVMQKEENMSQLKAVFDALDQDGDGFVRIEEFMEFATAYGADQVKDLTRFLDPSGLGVISFEDFHHGITTISNGGPEPQQYDVHYSPGDGAVGCPEEYDEQNEVTDSAYLGSESTYSECETFTDEDTGALVPPEMHEEVETDSGIEATLHDAEDSTSRFSLNSELHNHSLVTVLGGGEEHFEDFGESNTSELLEASEEGPVEGGPSDLQSPEQRNGSCLLSPSAPAPLSDCFRSFLREEALDFFCSQCHKQINRLEDLSTRLNFLEMTSSGKRLSSKKVARHLLQNSSMTLDTMSDLTRDILELADNDITDKVLLLERRVAELEKDSEASGEQHARLRQENLQLVHRANALEEQLKEQELYGEEHAEQEARRHREALCKLERETGLELENLQARLQQLDEENSELRSCVPCLRANIERLEEEKRKFQDEAEDMTDRLDEELESRRKMADKLSHERHLNQKEKESTQELIEDLRKQLEHLQLYKLEAEAKRGRSPSAGLQEYQSRTREAELEQEIRRLKQDNRSLKEQNDELNGQIINLSIQGAKNLMTAPFSDSLAAEINSVSRGELMEAVHKQEEINYRLQDYIDKIIVAIMECNPSILEVK